MSLARSSARCGGRLPAIADESSLPKGSASIANQLGCMGKSIWSSRSCQTACREHLPAEQDACWGESMRGGQGEKYRGTCSRSRPIMPYNSAATRTKTFDSMVSRCPPSQPHRKSTSQTLFSRASSMLVNYTLEILRGAHSAWLWVKEGCSLGESAGLNL